MMRMARPGGQTLSSVATITVIMPTARSRSCSFRRPNPAGLACWSPEDVEGCAVVDIFDAEKENRRFLHSFNKP